ncbi:carbohydrate ABC transporter permease [Nonomuraea sp. NPDC048882]|uniref:Carbohydrate ABC transporter membrane protein 2 (CUT1 family) n=2 Tax=Nonomuraea TaxID=83681 RepID=A0A2T0MR39_9ACTN|nr:carbohydrate ABC transporter permease [Nonomuraea fuscirosea]PRX60721.1 carbohydrate ABC transporter membrane protein 2 (CUT1 family) [Nonomuraea fuscirosea]WSA56231.1 carbohydrate ABC transporter permease [Nonomuraea fuscirosea]
MSRRRRALRRLPWWIAAAVLAIGCLIWIYPFLWMVSASLKTSAEVFTKGLDLLPGDPAWSNYERAWVEAEFGKYLLNTVIVTVCTVVVVVVRCAMTGYVLARHDFRGRRIIMGVLVATLFVPAGYTIIPLVDLSQKLGLLNSLTGMIVAMSGAANVAAILLYFGYFRGIPKELTEAALIDGAGFATVFFRVMLPLAKPVTATVTVLTFLSTWNAFFLPLVFTFSRPDLRTVSVGMLAFIGENATDWSGMAAAATISLLPVVALFIVLQRYFIEGIAGAVKS